MLGIARRKAVRGGVSVLGRQIQRNSGPSAPPFGSHGYATAGKEALLLRPGSKLVRIISLHGNSGFPASVKSLRQVGSYLQIDPSRQIWKRSYSSDGDVVEAVVPFMGESITDGTLAAFLKHPGDRVEVDEPIAQIETDKVTIDVGSPEAGIVHQLLAKVGDTVEPGAKIATISKSSDHAHVAPSESPTSKADATKKEKPDEKANAKSPAQEKPKLEDSAPKDKPKAPSPPSSKLSPSEPQLPPKDRERRVPMTRLRKRVATRLKDSQNTYAMLTTFNEVDMTNLMKLRSDYKDAFVEKHGVKLGFMSGFVKGAVSALQSQPIVNAVIDGDDIIYREYIDISIAVGTPKGLVVPVIRDADKMNFADIEKGINTLAKKATEGTISIDEMAGGSFTISNGGVYGSLLSTPIINPPQSAILGMHSIVNRPMVVGGQVVSRPMMNVALTYDHRLIDGREAVLFLRRIKDVVEDPRRLLLDI
ncbi:dihydrolipoyllysine-residue succinyltransferase component of 2-oxoglutarate dehydrogenase complex 1, mitochondrial [Spinacia oleracea]|uniref:dihydrolipoyllysine-residue succinyltransferase n=1 Tax=Spinacia oleracea TaxID=3562 RepID=A0A9R0HUY2_SPIOL|nr:dihydrolipoyllysine-residue succinyltransferase component of 2-oxoglutarate dehydrogenase complex 1, mitochondrial-like [Spinacia oleracea]